MAENYLYSDGDGNVYQVRGCNITYEPIQTIGTSGEAVSGVSEYEITAQQLEELIEMFQVAFKNRTFRAEKRNIGSGEIRRIEEEETFKVILAMRSPDKAKIEQFLSAIVA